MNILKRCKNAITILAFVLACVVCFHFVNRAMMAKEETELSSYYYDYAEETFDIIFLGSSVMKDAIQPVQLYEEYGFAAYNLSCGNQSLACSYYMLMEAIEKDSPQLVVLDVSYADEIYAIRSETFIHYMTDHMPYTSAARSLMIQDLVSEETQLEFYFPFYSYHTRWKELTASDLNPDTYQEDTLGSVVSNRTMSYDQTLFSRYDAEGSLGEISEDYIYKIIALCEDNDIELLMVACPVVAADGTVSEEGYNERLAIMEEVAQIASDNGITFLNFLDNIDALELDYYDDFQDGVHMNISGARKFTAFMGLFIDTNYDVPDRRGDEDDGAGLFTESFSKRMETISANYAEIIRARSFSTATRADTYLEALSEYESDEDLLILVCSQLLQGTALSDTVRDGLTALGLTGDFTSEDLTNYIAVICGGEVLHVEQEHFTEDLTYTGVQDGISFTLTTNSMTEGTPAAEVVIRGANVAPQEDTGIYIAVYDTDERTLLDCAALSFDGSALTHFEEAGN